MSWIKQVERLQNYRKEIINKIVWVRLNISHDPSATEKFRERLSIIDLEIKKLKMEVLKEENK